MSDHPSPETQLVPLPADLILVEGDVPAELGTRTTPDPIGLYLKRKAENSKRALRRALDLFAAALSAGEADAEGIPWHRVRHEHALHAMEWIERRYAPATANQALAAFRGVMRACRRLKLIDSEELADVIEEIPPARGERVRPGRDLSAEEIRALFLVCIQDSSPAGARDAALIAVLYGGGLRRVESVGVDVADYSLTTDKLVVRGKGNKERVTYVTGRGREAVAAWLEVRGAEPGPLFVPISWSGRIHVRRMTDQAVYAILQKRARQAGVEAFSPHDLRRTFAGDLLDAGVDIATVKELMGHAKVETTAGYDRRGERAKRKGVARLSIPYDHG